jgi:hypothetical protein
MLIALGLGLLGPMVLTVLMAFAGMTSAMEINTATKIVVWVTGIWALTAAGYEAWAGLNRIRSEKPSETA